MIIEPTGRLSLLLILLQRRLQFSSGLNPSPPLCLLHSGAGCRPCLVPRVICFYEASVSALRSLVKPSWVVFSPRTEILDLLTVFPGPDVSRCQFPDISENQICSFSENNSSWSRHDLHLLNISAFSDSALSLGRSQLEDRCIRSQDKNGRKVQIFLETRILYRILREMRRWGDWLCTFLHSIG